MSLTTFERRQQILRLLRENNTAKVTDLARMLDVSEGTIRNDLIALDEEQQILRVRGGAVLRDDALDRRRTLPARVAENAAAKLRIAKWAAELVEDGDTIALDASSTVLYMAQFLKARRNLTIVTNGIEVARAIAENPANTVILIGGALSTDGMTLRGALAENTMQSLFVKLAFLSCSGFSLENGLTEPVIDDAKLKTLMIRCAKQTIALIDSSKFDKFGLTPFASLEDIDHIFTDSNLSPQFVDSLRERGVNLTLCEENAVSAFVQGKNGKRTYRIGFANLGEELAFAQDVRRGLEKAAVAAGNIDLIIADNKLNSEVALRVADDLIAKGIDLMVEYQIDQALGGQLMDRFRQAKIPVIAVDIPIVGATYFGVDNYRTGYMAGTALGQWINEHWGGQFDVLVIFEEPRAGALPAMRIQGQLDGLSRQVANVPQDHLYRLDSHNTAQVSEENMAKLLTQLPKHARMCVLSFNDDAAIGALLAARSAGRESQVVIVGQGADRLVREEMRRANSRIIGSTAFMPEKYGEQIIALALKILRGEPVPPAHYIESVFIHPQNIDLFYPEN
ncbi:MAG: hypothetical protein OHK0023_01550 [Anaerolineae bacterium]